MTELELQAGTYELVKFEIINKGKDKESTTDDYQSFFMRETQPRYNFNVKPNQTNIIEIELYPGHPTGKTNETIVRLKLPGENIRWLRFILLVYNESTPPTGYYTLTIQRAGKPIVQYAFTVSSTKEVFIARRVDVLYDRNKRDNFDLLVTQEYKKGSTFSGKATIKYGDWSERLDKYSRPYSKRNNPIIVFIHKT